MKQRQGENQIRQIFAEIVHCEIGSIRKIEIGFSNDVYSVDDRYILKAGRSEEDEESLAREIYLCHLLKDRVHAPEIIRSDTSCELIDRTFIIYRKIPGENLYSKWHLFDETERRELIRQICSMLRINTKVKIPLVFQILQHQSAPLFQAKISQNSR